MDDKQRRGVFTGLFLIVFGAGLYLLDDLDVRGGLFLLLIGGLFLAFYFYRRVFGLIIPGCILTSLGAYTALEGTFLGADLPVYLGLGFISIYVIARIYEGRAHWWPLIPGTVLILSGVPALWSYIVDFVQDHWPLLLIGIGLLVLIGSLTGRRSAGQSGGG